MYTGLPLLPLTLPTSLCSGFCFLHSLQWKTATTKNPRSGILESPWWTRPKEVDTLGLPRGNIFSSEQCHSQDRSWRTSSRVFPLNISL